MNEFCVSFSWRYLLTVILVAYTVMPKLSTALFAQNSTAPATLRVRSQLVVLDVVVTDVKGNIVTNLTQGDFSIFENGVQEEVRSFDPPKANTPPAEVLKDKNGHDHWGDASLTMIVIDELNTPFEQTAYSRFEVERFLKAQPALLGQPTIGLWLNDAGLHPLSGLTRDRDALLASIHSHQASLPNKMNRSAAFEQLSASLTSIQQIALFSRGSKGNNQIIWVGRSFPAIDTTKLNSKYLGLLGTAIRRTVELLLMSRATIYAINPMGADSPLNFKAMSNLTGSKKVTAFDPKDPLLTGFDFPGLVALTGGKVFDGRNDLNNEIAESIQRATNFYRLTYVPIQAIESNEFRKIDIYTKDRSLQVQTKQGYYPATPEQSVLTHADLRYDLHEAVVSDLVYSGVGLRIDHCQLEQDRITTTCSIIAEVNSQAFEHMPDGSEDAQITAVIAALNNKSTPVANKVDDLRLNVPPDHTQSGSSTSQTMFKLHLNVPAGATTLRVVVSDSNSRIGTANYDLQKPAIADDYSP
jgi:VWFA-related protein